MHVKEHASACDPCRRGNPDRARAVETAETHERLGAFRSLCQRQMQTFFNHGGQSGGAAGGLGFGAGEESRI
jgi:hypothetical protein